ncbi:MAG: hypothetical protein H7222_04890 [Methylotenera sp.]|nr:hypothetical protein [Oligoflexia bacterium]
MKKSSFRREYGLFVFLVSLAAFTSCGKDDSSSSSTAHDRKMKDGRFASVRWPDSGSFQYNYTETCNGSTCTTGALQFSNKADYCMGLTDRKLNLNCALGTRKRTYLENCGNDFEVYPAPTQTGVPPPPYVIPAVGDRATYATTLGRELSSLTEEVTSVDLQSGTYLVQVTRAGRNGLPTTSTNRVTMSDDVALANAAVSADTCNFALTRFQSASPRPGQYAKLESEQYRSLQTCHIHLGDEQDWWFAQAPFSLFRKEYCKDHPLRSMTAELMTFEKH